MKSFGVLVETPAGLFAKITSINVVHQKRASSILGVAEFSVQDPHDVEAGVQANEVSKGEGAHGDIGAQFHGLVNVFLGADSLVQGINSFIDVWHEKPVGNEARYIS